MTKTIASLFSCVLLLSACQSNMTGTAPSSNPIKGRKSAMIATLFGKNGQDSFENRYATAQDNFPARDRLVTDLLLLADLNFQDYKQELNARVSGADFGTSAAVLTMNAISTVSGTTAVKTTIAALTTALTGAKSEFNRSILHDKALPSLIAQMQAARAKQNAVIMKSLAASRKTGDHLQYPIGEAVRDVLGYYSAGTLVGALAELSTSAAAEEKAAVDSVKKDVRGIN